VRGKCQDTYRPHGVRRLKACSEEGVGRLLVRAARTHAPEGRARAAGSPTLVDELLNFRGQITSAANVLNGAWRSGQHDDPVLAASLACWWAEGRKLQAASVT
jgi:hypothetical protein